MSIDFFERMILIGKRRRKYSSLYDLGVLIPKLSDQSCEEGVSVWMEWRCKISSPDDNIILECALAADVKYIVTGDPHLLNLEWFEKIKIISPATFVTEFVTVHGITTPVLPQPTEL